MFKSKNAFWLIISVAFNLAFLAALIYMSQFNRRSHSRWRPPEYPKTWTETERVQIDSMRHAFPRQIQGLRDSIGQERRRLAEVMQQSEPDTLIIHHHIQRIGAWQSAISEEVYRQFLKERDTLLPEHRQAFVDAMVQHMTRSYGPPPKKKKKRSSKRP